MRSKRSVITAVAILTTALTAGAQELLTRRTKDLDLVYYDKAHQYLTYHLVRSFENSLAFHEKLFDYKPSEPVVILMQDFADYGHGGTSTVPWNYISIGIEPFDYVYETMPANERINWLMHHELVHVVATDKGADTDLLFRHIFHGKVAPIKEEPLSMVYSYMTSPRWYSPRWYHEGIAVFLETWMAGGVGRVLGGYDEMVFRTMVLENSYFYDVVGLESEGTTIDFQVGQNSYLYGTRFMTYLASEHGPEKLIEWFNRSHGSKRYFKSQFEKVYGVGLDEEWRRWIASEHQWQKKNLELIRQYDVTRETPIRTETLGSVSRTFYDRQHNAIYAAVNRPAHVAQIVSIDAASGKITPLGEVDGPALYFVTSLAYDAKGRKIFYTTNNSYGWRDLNEIDLNSGKRGQLLKNFRGGDLVVNPADQSIWAIQHHNGFSSLIRIPQPYKAWQTVLTLEYGRDIFDIDIAPDGKTLSAGLIEVTGDQQLVALDIDRLLKGDSTFRTLHTFENNGPENFVFSPDGRYLYGTTYYTGVSNVWRYDMQIEKMEALTNVETGLFRPMAISNDSMIAYRYTARGFSPVFVGIKARQDINAINYLGQQVVERHPIVKTWNAGSPARVNLDEVTTYAGPYRPMLQTRLGSLYPVVEGYKSTAAAGIRFNFSDPLGLNTIDVTAAASPQSASSERLHLKAGLEHPPWKLRLNYNATDFYDLFGPTRTSRKGHSAALSYHQFLVYERPRTIDYTITGAYYGGLDTLPDYQNVAAPFREYATLRGELHDKDLRRTIGAVDVERGQDWSIAASSSVVDSDVFPRLWGTYERGLLLPLDHSSIWLRGAAGKSWGDRSNVFSNFYFGAFGNNWIDWQEVRRYRDDYSFPGLELNEAGGHDFVKGGVEWTSPPLRFERAGVPSLYANWARLALFSSVLTTDVTGSSFRRNFHDVGAQVDVSLVLFSNLESMFSVGMATAFEKGNHSNEIMVSLKLLR
ncbi:MAG: YncE family protein [Thermoanaerobaculia bacterium]